MTNPWPTGMFEVADGVFAYVQEGGGLCVSNAGLIVGPDRCIAIDSLFSPSMTLAFRDAIRRVTDKPVRLLINTHHHVDHTLGNALFPEAQVLSHVNAKREQRRVGKSVLDVLRPLLPELVAETDAVTQRLPNMTFSGSARFLLGGRAIELLHFGPAHTIGDALIVLPAERLLFAGDVAFHYITPLGLEGHIGGWRGVCDEIDSLEIDTIVPGHGPVGGKPELREMRGYLDTIWTQGRAAFDAGVVTQDATRQIDLGEYASWPEPERLAFNVSRLYQEFRGEL
jgi:cyclase